MDVVATVEAVKRAMNQLEPAMEKVLAKEDVGVLVGALSSHLGFILSRMYASGRQDQVEGILAALTRAAYSGKGSVVPPSP